MLVLVCGSRDWTDVEAIRSALDLAWMIGRKDFHVESRTQMTIIHGGAPGADSIAHKLAHDMGFLELVEPADWKQYGKAAGPIRNRKMLELEPDIVFAFQRGASRGTQNTIDQARNRGIKVVLTFVPE